MERAINYAAATPPSAAFAVFYAGPKRMMYMRMIKRRLEDIKRNTSGQSASLSSVKANKQLRCKIFSQGKILSSSRLFFIFPFLPPVSISRQIYG